MVGVKKSLSRKVLMIAVILCIVPAIATPSKAGELFLTPEERDYINKEIIIKAASIDGGAPLHYKDSNGQIKGIAIKVLDEISIMTGLIFEYRLYDSINEAFNSKADILFGVTKEYTSPDIILSIPYMESETILFYNSLSDPNELPDKKYAAIKGGTLPEGIEEKNAVYFNNREETLDAVETGKADYGFGNAYSLAFYILQNGYKNIITIPAGKEERAYCMGLTKENGILLSIINKSIRAIDENRMGTLILDVASRIERRITTHMIIDAYGREILGLVLLIIAALLFSVFLNVRAKNRFRMENKRYNMLSHISNECLFEYIIKSGHLEISDKFAKEGSACEKMNEMTDLLKDTLTSVNINNPGENVLTIELPPDDGEKGVLKVIYSGLYDGKKKPYSIIGKLVDISEEIKEKEELLSKSRLDGLTGLYNATAAKELIIKSIKGKPENKTDGFIIIDCDRFKDINDTFGHLKGDQVLVDISKSLKLAFRQTDIIGRIGGDEFCVYMHGIPSADFVRSGCEKLRAFTRNASKGIPLTLSMGIAILDQKTTYENLFQKADEALYAAKERGSGHIVVG